MTAVRPLLPLAFVILALPAACSDAGTLGPIVDAGQRPDAGGVTNVDASSQAGVATLASLTVSTGSLVPAFEPTVTDYSITSLNSLYPITVTAVTSDPASSLHVHGLATQSGTAATLTLEPGENLEVLVEHGSLAPSRYVVHYVPGDLPKYSVTSMPGAGTEDLLLTPGSNYLLMVDRAGRPLYYRTFLGRFVENFAQTTLPGGSVAYSVTVGAFDPGGWTLGVDHVMDQHFQDLADLKLLSYAQHGELPAEGHDFVLLDSQRYIAMSYVQRTLDLSALNPAWSSKAQVMSAVVQEVDHGNVLLEWDSANVPSLYADSVFSNAFDSASVSDYVHLNSIAVDPTDDNVVLSFRHTSSIVKIDRSTGKILWTLGGKEDDFGLTADQTFAYQHDVRMYGDGTMTVFDNGYMTHQTRALSFALDPVNHRVTSFKVLYIKPAPEPGTDYMGSVAPLPGGRVLLGWGGWFDGVGAPSTVIAPASTEVAGGVPVWSLTFDTPTTFSYRALPIASP